MPRQPIALRCLELSFPSSPFNSLASDDLSVEAGGSPVQVLLQREEEADGIPPLADGVVVTERTCIHKLIYACRS